MTDGIMAKMKEYDVKAVPTTIIDGKIKVVGIPDFPWICGDDLYKKLKQEYPL
jgi:protein-disulfide isomerase